jgi:hypothetical protein
MSHAVHHDPTVPRGALIGAAAVLIFTMSVTGATKLGWLPHSADPSASRAAQNIAPAQTRLLRFADREDGAVVVSDATSGEEIQVLVRVVSCAQRCVVLPRPGLLPVLARHHLLN